MNLRSTKTFTGFLGRSASVTAALLLLAGIWPLSNKRLAIGLPTRVAAAEKMSTGASLFYSNTFQSPVGAEWSDSSTSTTPCGEHFLGQFGNQTVSLSLASLATHTSLTVTFDLYVINSWNGSSTVTPSGVSQGPDIWDLSVGGGPTLVHTTFSNNGNLQAFPGSFPGPSHPSRTGATEVNTLGYTFDYGAAAGGIEPSDAVYHLSSTFTHSADSVQLNFSALLGPSGEPIGQESWGLANVVVVGTVTVPTSTTAALKLVTKTSTAVAATGSTVTYTTTVTNDGPAQADGVIVEEDLDQSETFLSMTTSQGTFSAPTPNCAFSRVFASLGSLAKKGKATITLTVGIISAPGLPLTSAATIDSTTVNTNAGAESGSAKIEGGGVALITWQQPSGGGTPAPQDVQFGPGVASPEYFQSGGFGPVAAQTGSCTLAKVNIYKDQVSPSNLIGSAAEGLLQANVPVAPGGSSYVITNVWNCGGTIIESGPSNVITIASGPKISAVAIKGRLKILGSGFLGQPKVFVNGVGFQRSARVVGGNEVLQSGPLVDGTTIDQLPAQILVTVQTSEGGITSLVAVK